MLLVSAFILNFGMSTKAMLHTDPACLLSTLGIGLGQTGMSLCGCGKLLDYRHDMSKKSRMPTY
jgi:hypothetical protein